MDGFEETYLPPPPEFAGAPPWEIALWHQGRRDQHRNAAAFMALEARLLLVERKLGEEPDAEGHGGKGLIGEVRSLTTLRSKGIGFIAAIGLTGALILAGLVHWIQTIAGKTPAPAAH